jgi:hypothetical protein
MLPSEEHHDRTNSKCRMCCNAEHIKHTVAGCTTLAPSEYTNRHNRVAGYIHWMICKHMGLQVTDRYYEHIPEKGLLWACGTTWGLTLKVVHWWYISIIRQSITFAALVWWPGCQTANPKKRLRRVQRLACLGIMGAMCTTPTSAMEALTCLPPLELVVQSEVSSAAHRLWSLVCWSYLHPI